MRKFILVAAMVLVSATAQAGGSRGLTLASNDEPVAAAQPKARRSAEICRSSRGREYDDAGTGSRSGQARR